MRPAATDWQLAGFEDLLQRWVEDEAPAVDLRVVVADWIFSRYDDPFSGVSREPGFDNLWVGPVPGTRRGGTVVVCSYFVYGAERSSPPAASRRSALPI